MRIAIISFPGSNCESESIAAIKQAGMEAEEFLWNGDQAKLALYDGYFLIGGFSYEDRSRSGIIASLDPVMDVIRAESKKGKPVLGICNGAQILVETGLVPGLPNDALGMALAANRRVKDGKVLGTGYYNDWVHIALSAEPKQSAFTRQLPKDAILRVPVAHGEGRFLLENELLQELIARGLTTFRYCDEQGKITPEFPVNPNGARHNLAAITNATGNVMAMMPHPERSPDGGALFTSMREYIAAKTKISADPLVYTPPQSNLQPYKKPADAMEMMIGLIITDKEARTIETTLQHLDIHASIKRYTHWELHVAPQPSVPSTNLIESITTSGELFNSNKEILLPNISLPTGERTRYLLVRHQDDVFGASKLQTLRDRFGLTDLSQIIRGTLWQITVEAGNIEAVVEHILDTHILFNQFSQECFFYENLES